MPPLLRLHPSPSSPGTPWYTTTSGRRARSSSSVTGTRNDRRRHRCYPPRRRRPPRSSRPARSPPPTATATVTATADGLAKKMSNERSRGGSSPFLSDPVRTGRHAGAPERGREELPAVALAARRLDDPALERWASSMMALGRAARVGGGGGGVEDDGRAHTVDGMGDHSLTAAPATARPCPSSEGSRSRDSSPRRRHCSSGMLLLPQGARGGEARQNEHGHEREQHRHRQRRRRRQERAGGVTTNGKVPLTPGGEAREEGSVDGGDAPGSAGRRRRSQPAGSPEEEVGDDGGSAAKMTEVGLIWTPAMSPRRRRGSDRDATSDDEDGWAHTGSGGGGSGGSGCSGDGGGRGGSRGKGDAFAGAGVAGVDCMDRSTERVGDEAFHLGKEECTGDGDGDSDGDGDEVAGAQAPPAAAAEAAEWRKPGPPPRCSLFDLADQNIDDI